MARNAALPILTAKPGLTHYLEEIRRFPMLERQEEYLLAACRTHEIDGQILKQMESTSAFSATKFFLAGNLDSFVSPFG